MNSGIISGLFPKRPSPIFFYNFVSVWDVFRLNDNGASGIDASRFSFEPRELRLGIQALGTLDIYPPGLPIAFRLANDPDAGSPNGQPSHWWSYQTTDDQYIGIMRARGASGVPDTRDGVYLQPADIKAFDLMGYKIRQSLSPAPVVPPEDLSPEENEVVLGAPLLSWDSVAAASFYNAVLYDLGSDGTETPEFLWGLASLNTTSTRLPGTLMQPNHYYEWRAVAQNTHGSAAARVTFVTAATHCPPDLNNSGLVDDPDFSLFVTQYDVLDCTSGSMPQNCSGDFNLDAVVDDSDFSIFVLAYDNLGCF
ncbi:MAG: hypothetical protein JNM86_02965 [Phycisphaerae bacterium]|nr:hypothetical protein [Phycisphaerae bacterium]